MSNRLILTIPVLLVCLAAGVLVSLPPVARTQAAPATTAVPDAAARPEVPACIATLSCRGQGPIVALGDSMTYGYGDGVTLGGYLQGVPLTPDGPRVVGSYPWDLARLVGVPVVNDGMSGDTAYTALHPPARGNRYRPAGLQIAGIIARHPRLVIVGFGSAEAAYGVPLARAAADLDALLTAFDGIPTVIVGTHVDCSIITVCLAPQPVEYTDAWDSALGSLALRHHSAVVTDVLAGLSGAGAMTDSLHPNARGYAIVAARIAVAVRQRLTQPEEGGWGPGFTQS